MFERFTDRSRRVVVLAQEEARTLCHSYIGSEHLLLGMVHEGDGVAAKALAAFKVTLDDARLRVREVVDSAGEPPRGHIPFTPRAKRILDLALREALKLGHSYVGTEHLLLGLIRQGTDDTPQYEGIGVTVLVDLGVELPALRQHVLNVLSGVPASRVPALEAESQEETAASADRELRGRAMLAVRGAPAGKLQAIIDLLNE